MRWYADRILSDKRGRSVRGPFAWVALTAFMASSTPCIGQDSTEVRLPDNRIQARLTTGTILELQYTRMFSGILSADALFQTTSMGPSIGITLYPLDWLFGQARIGLPIFQESSAPDGPPPFDPDYMVGLRAGVIVRLPESRLFMEFAIGRVLVIQQKYCSTCGGFFPDGSTMPARVIRMRQESLDLLSLGLGLNF
ncbi:MAG: hypothetical protein WB699_14250 [Bacteroidota bacterium]